MQLAYSSTQDPAVLGMLADTSFKHTDSKIAASEIAFGRGVVRVPDTSDQARPTSANYSTITVSADLIASNSTIVTVNSVATTATVYASSHAATMAAIVVKVLALSTVSRAYLDSSNNRIIHIWSIAATNTSSAETTLGSTQPTWTAAASMYASDFYGVAQMTHSVASHLIANTTNVYAAEAVANILRRGRIWVNFETAFDPDKDTLYVRHTADTGKYVGDFGNTSDSSKCTSLSGLPITVITHLTAAGMGVIEINLP